MNRLREAGLPIFYSPSWCLLQGLSLEVNLRTRLVGVKVVGVIDGDSIRVMHAGKAEKIRLNGIDGPERGQAFGKRAKQATSAMV